jgi:hypothetical protein
MEEFPTAGALRFIHAAIVGMRATNSVVELPDDTLIKYTVANDVTCEEMCGDREPTLAVVVQLAELFGVTVMEFLEPAKKPPRRGKKK